MHFAHPSFLWLFPVVAMGPWFLFRGREVHSFLQKLLPLTAALALAFGLIAMARPMVDVPVEHPVRVTLIDASPQISERDLRIVELSLSSPSPAGGVFLLTDRSRMVPPERMLTGWLSQARVAASAPASQPAFSLADAINAAAESIPAGARGHIDLYSAGCREAGFIDEAVARALRRGIAIQVHPLESSPENDLILRDVSVPNHVGVGATVNVQLDIESSRPGPVDVVIQLDGESALKRERRELRAGRQQIQVPMEWVRAGLQSCRVELKSSWDSKTDNNTLLAATHVTAPYRVLVLESPNITRVRDNLRAMLAASASVESISADRLVAEDWPSCDLLVLGDVPADTLTGAAQRNLQKRVEQGLGLWVVGGRQSFGAGGYAQSALRDCLPLYLSQEAEQRDPSVTLVVIIDTSGSMTGPRLALAKELARLAIRRLQAHDKVGIVEFYGTKRWAARIQSAANAIDINRALNRLSAGGGTVILPAIEEAYYALLNVQTRTRHVLIITDGGVETGDFQSLITRMAEAGITVSTVMAGPGQHSAFLSSLAHWGNGRFYAAADRFELAEILLKRPESVPGSPFVEGQTALLPASSDKALSSISWPTAPAIGGYARTSARPTAEVLLKSASGDPVLARWRFGLGQVATWTSDLGGPWTDRFIQWPAFSKLVSSLSRDLAAAGSIQPLQIQLRRVGASLVVQATPAIGAQLKPAESLRLTLRGPDGSQRETVVEPRRAGEWLEQFDDLPPGTYEVQATASDNRTSSAAVCIPPNRDVPVLEQDRTLLDRIDQLSRTAEGSQGPIAGRKVAVDLYPWCVIGFWVFMLLTVLVRRWPARASSAIAGASAAFILALLCTSPQRASAQTSRPASRPASAPASRPAMTATQASEVAKQAAQVRLRLDAATQYSEATDTLAQVQLRLASAGISPSELTQLLAADEPLNPMHARISAYCAAQRGDFDRARRGLERCIVAGNTSAGVWADLARWLELAGETESALNAIDVAIARTTTPAERQALLVRRIGLIQDHAPHQIPGALEELSRSMGPAAGQAYVRQLAAVLGEPNVAATMRGNPASQPADREALLCGAIAVQTQNWAAAQRNFAAAAVTSRSAKDRQFALQQQVAVARKQGRLPALAETWMKESDRAPDRLPMLQSILRELGRVDDVLALLKRRDAGGEFKKVIDGTAFQAEVVAAAIEAGRLDAAERSYRLLIEQDPTSIGFRTSLSRLLLLQGNRDQAVQVFRDAISSSASPEFLMEVADAAAGLSLDALAFELSARVAAISERALTVAIWRAQLLTRRGKSTEALAELERAIPLAADDPGRLRALGEAYEKLSRPQRAIELLRKALAKVGDEDTELRLAYLLEQTQQFAEACTLWRKLWEKSDSPAHEVRASRRLLDLAAKTGIIADLAIEFEEKLAQKQTNQREMSLLVDIYTKLGDEVSAAEVLHAFARQSGNEVEATRQLSRAYLRMGRLKQTDALLRRLLQIDPQRAPDYLQEQTVLAVERQRPKEATAAIIRLADLSGDDSTRDEMSAGVLDLLNQHAQAAAAYERVLARYPDRVEVWLLWANAMLRSGRGAEATARLQVLVEEADQDDLFLVAVDGLLNLEAGRAPLQSALRRMRERIAAAPDKIYLYDAAADLLEAIGAADQINSLMEVAVVFAGEQRGSILREMMDRAKTAGQRDRVIAYGNALVAADFSVPPQVMLDLGETLLEIGDAAQAERAFNRACLLGDYVAVRQRVSDSYERAGRLAQAERVVGELLITDSSNVALLNRDGGLLEQLGRYEAAIDRYLSGFDVLRGKIAAIADAGSAATLPSLGARRRPSIATNIDEITQFFDPLVGSILTCARTDELRSRVLAALQTIAEQELQATTRDAAKGIETAVRFPRLLRVADAFRAASFGLHEPDRADDFDRLLLKRFPKDTSIESYLLKARVTWGLADRAAKLARSKVSQPIELRLLTMLRDGAALKTYLAGKAADPLLDSRLAPALVMAERDDDLRALLDHADAEWKVTPLEPARALQTSAVSINDTARMVTWTARLLDTTVRMSRGGKLDEALMDVLRPVWPSLPAASQQSLLERLDKLAQARQPRSVEVDIIRAWLDPRLAGTPDAVRIRQQAAKTWAAEPARIAALIQAAPLAERSGLLEQAWTGVDGDDRIAVLLQTAGSLAGPTDDVFLTTFRRLLESSPALKLNRHTPYGELVRSGWHENRATPSPGEIVANHVLNLYPREPAIQAAAACAFSSMRDVRRAAEAGNRAIGLILADRKLEADQAEMIQDVASAMPDADREAAVLASRSLYQAGQASVLDLYVGGVMLLKRGRTDEGLAMLRDAMKLAPTNVPVKRTLLTTLQADRRYADVVSTFEPYLTDRSVVQDSELSALSDAHRELFDPLGALKVMAYDNGPVSSVRTLQIEAMLGRTDRVIARLRRYLVTNRNEGRFYTPLGAGPPLPGGLQEYLIRQAPGYVSRANLFASLAHLPHVSEEFEAMLQAASPDRRDVPGLIEASVAGDRDPRARLQLLEKRLTDNTFDDRDLRTLAALVSSGDVRVPQELLTLLDARMSIVAPDDADSLEAWARLHASIKSSARASTITRWLVATELATSRRNSEARIRFRRFDLYANNLPGDRKAAEGNRLLRASLLLPFEPPGDRVDAELLKRIRTGGDSQMMEDCRRRLHAGISRIGATGYYPRLYQAIVQDALERGADDEATSHLRELIRMAPAAYGDFFPLDSSQLLPSAIAGGPSTATQAVPGRVAHAAEIITGVLLSALKSREIGLDQAVRALALLAHGCAESEDLEAARTALRAARQAAGDTPALSWLWIADVAAQVEPASHPRLLEAMVKSRVIPIARMAVTLDDIEKASNAAHADELAVVVASYSDLPEVLRRALRHARRVGDDVAAEGFHRRLQTYAASTSQPATTTAPTSQ